MTYILYAWLSAITYGLGGVIGKLATKHQINNPWLYNIIWALLTLVFTIPFALMGNVGLPSDWGSMILLGVASAVTSITFTFALYAVDLSILSPLSNIRSLFTALIGVLFFGEYLSTEKWLFILLLSLAGLFIHLDEKMKLKSFLSKATITVFVWIITSVWFNSTIKIASINNGFWEVSFWSNLITLILLLPTWPLFSKDLSITPIKNYAGVAINTALWTAGLLFSIKALAVNVSISTAIMSVPLSMIFAMILSFISPKLLEKHPPKIYIIRITAAAIMFISALALSN